jgi:hypothetical protein
MIPKPGEVCHLVKLEASGSVSLRPEHEHSDRNLVLSPDLGPGGKR